MSMTAGNLISERLEPEVFGSLEATWKASAFFVEFSGSACLPRRSRSPLGSTVPLMPLSGIWLADR